MQIQRTEIHDIRTSEDIVRVRQVVREFARGMGFNLVDQTKIVTASSELARNTLDYGGGGAVQVETIQNGSKQGLRLVFMDEGPGIPDIELALKDGYTSGAGMGLGLGGAKRLSHEFHLETEPQRGTKVTIVRWKGL